MVFKQSQRISLAMTARDQYKLTKAGFTIIRIDFENLRIKSKGQGGHEWKTFENGFKNKTDLLKRMSTLLKSEYIIED